MITMFLRRAILLEILLACFTCHNSAFDISGDYHSIKDVLRFAKSDSTLIRQARVIAQEFVAKDNIQNTKEAMCCVSIFKLAGDTTSALSVIKNMDSRNLKPDTFLYNNVISVCTKVSDWRLAIDVLLLMQSNGVSSDTISFSSAISACAKAGRWRESLNLLKDMSASGVRADTICYSSAISACAAAGCWKEALLLLSDMKAKRVPIDTIVCNSAISACGPSGEWTVAIRLMDLMRVEGLTLTAYTYAGAMTACDVAGQCDQALKLLDIMLAAMITPPSPPPHSPPITSVSPIAMIYNTTDSISRLDDDSRSATSTLIKPREPYESQHKSLNTDIIRTATVPFNVAIGAAMKCGRILKGKELFDRMGTLGVPKNTVTYTTMISGITKSKNFNQRIVLDVHEEMIAAGVKRNAAIFGAVIAAAEKEQDCVLILNLIEEMKKEGIPTTSFVYHSAISASGKAGKCDIALELLEEMKERRVERTTTTYSLLINALKRSGMYDEALQFLVSMQEDCNEEVVRAEVEVGTSHSGSDDRGSRIAGGTVSAAAVGGACDGDDAAIVGTVSASDSSAVGGCPMHRTEGKTGVKKESAGLKPDTTVYSFAISVCVECQKWDLALELLEQMEAEGIQRNVVTYNSVIEALSGAGETHRSELVYQSALRTGIYNHWHRTSQHYNTQRERPLNNENKPGVSEVMDLHNFPLAVAKVAVMLALGEMCTGSIPIADPLILITGRGNHATADGQRGVLRRELLLFCSELGLKLLSSDEIEKRDNDVSPIAQKDTRNPGRLWLTKSATLEWLEEQRKQDEAMGHSGTKGAHGNMFLKVAMAKHRHSQGISEKPLNVRAVCPFSSATHAEHVRTDSVEHVRTDPGLITHAATVLTEKVMSVSGYVAPIATAMATAVATGKKCPAHAAPNVPVVEVTVAAAVAAVSAVSTGSTVSTPTSDTKVSKGKCPAHASVPIAAEDEYAIEVILTDKNTATTPVTAVNAVSTISAVAVTPTLEEELKLLQGTIQEIKKEKKKISKKI